MIGPIAVLYGALATGVREAPRRRQTSQQEYVYAQTYGSRGGISRFPIVNGIVSSTPTSTLTYQPAYGTAVGADGTLYVTGSKFLRHHLSQPDILVFAPGASGHPIAEREIDRTPSTNISDEQVAVDQDGYLYYASSQYKTNKPPTIEVFAPSASGRAKYVLRIPDGGHQGHNYMAVDGAGNLYVETAFGVDEWTNPHSKPVKVKRYCWPAYLQFGSIAVNEAGDLFAVTTAGYEFPRLSNVSFPAETITEFPAGTDPCPKHPRFFTTPVAFRYAQGMGEYGGNLYLQLGRDLGLYEIPETGAVVRAPTAFVPNPVGGSVGVGP